MGTERNSFAACVDALLLLMSAGSSSANTCFDVPPIRVRHICGIVINGIGERIPNAKLTLLKNEKEAAAVEADSNGKFEFERVEAGNYLLRVQARGYFTLLNAIRIVRPAVKCKGELQVVLGLAACQGGIVRVRH